MGWWRDGESGGHAPGRESRGWKRRRDRQSKKVVVVVGERERERETRETRKREVRACVTKREYDDDFCFSTPSHKVVNKM